MLNLAWRWLAGGHGDQPRYPEQVQGEHHQRVDAHVQNPASRPEDEPVEVDDREQYPQTRQVDNPSCSLQALDGNNQQEPDDLQLKALWRDRMDLLGEQPAQPAEGRFDVLAYRLAQELLPRRQ